MMGFPMELLMVSRKALLTESDRILYGTLMATRTEMAIWIGTLMGTWIGTQVNILGILVIKVKLVSALSMILIVMKSNAWSVQKILCCLILHMMVSQAGKIDTGVTIKCSHYVNNLNLSLTSQILHFYLDQVLMTSTTTRSLVRKEDLHFQQNVEKYYAVKII